MALPNIYLHMCGHLFGFDAGGIKNKLKFFLEKSCFKMKLGQAKCFSFKF
jgi:hypothetical protein